MTTQSSLPDTAGAAATNEKTEPPEKVIVGGASHLAGMFWFAGWLFTVGFAKLIGFQAVLALLVWPYFLGRALE
jgi:hypothetical protein